MQDGGPKQRFNSTWAHTHADGALVTSPRTERWDVSRGMPRTGGWVSVGPPGGMMAERPYIENYHINLEKPMVQVGEVPTLAGQKNSTRSGLVRQAEQLSADGFIFRDIADNKAKHQTVAYIFDPDASATKLEAPPLTWETFSPTNNNPEITKASDLSFLQQAPKRISSAERAGVPKGERNLQLKINPLGGVNSDVDTYLINRTNTPFEFVDGKLVWMPTGGRASAAGRKTIHFTTDQPVTSHGGGNWDGVSETALFPYKQVVKDNGNPMNIEPMDTYFSAQYPFILRQEGAKIFTGNRQNYAKYKRMGVDVYTTPEALSLQDKILPMQNWHNTHIKIFNDYVAGVDKKGYRTPEEQHKVEELFNIAHKYDDQYYELRAKYDGIQREWARQQTGQVPISIYKQMEQETGLPSGVSETAPNSFIMPDHPRIQYHTAPSTHSNAWFFDIHSPEAQFSIFQDYLKQYPKIITNADWALMEQLLRKNKNLLDIPTEDLRLKALMHRIKTQGYKKGGKFNKILEINQNNKNNETY